MRFGAKSSLAVSANPTAKADRAVKKAKSLGERIDLIQEQGKIQCNSSFPKYSKI